MTFLSKNLKKVRIFKIFVFSLNRDHIKKNEYKITLQILCMNSQKSEIFKTPFVLFMGPQRAGTSWLHRYFLSRDDVCISTEVKELFFFDFNFEKGQKFYKSHFKLEDHHKISIEVSATYFHHPEAPKRVYEYFGKELKLICPLRHPVVRSYSLYNHYKRYGLVQGSLEEACKKLPEIIKTSHYSEFLKNWIDVFGQNAIHICFQEDLAKDQDLFVKTICEYLEISNQAVPEEIAGYYNAATEPPIQLLATMAQKGAEFLRSYKMYSIINAAKAMGVKKLVFGPEQSTSSSSSMAPAEKLFLERVLKEEIIKLEQLLGYSIKQWADNKMIR